MSGYDADFVECYNLYKAQLANFIYMQIKDLDTSQELVQDIFTYLYERKIPIEARCPTLKSFLYRIAKHRTIDYFKKAIKSANTISNAEELIIDDSTIAQVEDYYCEGEVLGTMRSLISESPETSREVISRRIYSGHRNKKICRDLKLSEYRVNKIIREFSMRAREKLSEYYTDR